jgi:copper chaperone CopZ
MIKVGAVLVALATAGLAMTGMASPTASYEVKGLHLCCNGCNGAATGAINGGGGKDAAASGGSVTFTAANDAAAQKALDKLTAAGFWGTIESKTLKLTDDSGTALPPKAKPVKVSSGTFKGAHNCCDGCNKKLKEAIKGVEGVTEDDCAANKPVFVVKGEFDPAALIKAIHDAGYHAKLDKADVIRPSKK